MTNAETNTNKDAKVLEQGFVDQLDTKTRNEVIENLCSDNPNFKDTIDQAILKYVQSGKDYYKCKQTPKVGYNNLIEIKEYGKLIVDQIDDDNEVVWCRDYESFSINSRPIPYCAFEQYSIISKNIESNYTYLAKQFLINKYYDKVENIVTLKLYRNDYFEKKSSAYGLVHKEDVEKELRSFLSHNTNVQTSKSKLDNVMENLKLDELSYIPKDISAPLVLGDGEFKPLGEKVLFCGNGHIDIEKYLDEPEAKLLPTSSRYFNTTQIAANYDADAKCPRFEKFLNEVQPEEDVQALIQEMIGLFLIPYCRFERFFMFSGEGSNGKSVLADIIEGLVGKKNVSNAKFSSQSDGYEHYKLEFSLVNILKELPVVDKFTMNEDMLKNVSSGEDMSVRRIYGAHQTITPVARMLFLTNAIPFFSDKSNGIWRRLVLIPFNTTIDAKDSDINLAKKIKDEELSGILNWALVGLKRLMNRGTFDIPQSIMEANSTLQSECNHEKSYILESVEKSEDNSYISSLKLYEQYKQYCNERNFYIINMNKFTNIIKSTFPGITFARKMVGLGANRKKASVICGLQWIVDSEDGE
jgi:P4 family phage/plasmid primase-like protien